MILTDKEKIEAAKGVIASIYAFQFWN